MSGKFFTLLAFIIIVAFSGCSEDDNIVNQEEHFDAVGIIIKQSGVTIFDYFGPDYAATDSIAGNDTLKISRGLNPHWDIYFYDESGDQINPPVSTVDGGHQSLAATFTPSSLAELWWHDGEEGAFEFHIRGNEEGYGTVKFNVMHEGHADFTTLPIPLVIDSNVLHDEPVGIKLYDEESGTLLASSVLADSGSSSGTLSVNINDSTEHIEVYFYDSEDIEFHPSAPPHSLVVESSNESVVSVGGIEVEEPWAFKLLGNTAGSAEITVKLFHDGAVGKIFEPVAVQVQ